MADIDIGLGLSGLQGIPQTLASIVNSLKQMETSAKNLSSAFDNINSKAGGQKGVSDAFGKTSFEADRLKKRLDALQKAKQDALSNKALIDQIESEKAAIKAVTNEYTEQARAKKKLARDKEIADIKAATKEYNEQEKAKKKLAAETEKIRKKEIAENEKILQNQQKVRLEYSQQIGLIKQLENRMSLLKQRMQAATDPKDVRKLSDEIRRLSLQKKELTTGVTDLGKQTKVTSGIMGQFRGVLINTFGAYAVLAGIKSTFNTIREFEKAMTMVKAVTNATASEMQLLFDITKNIVRKGSVFDPKTLAETQLELSKLGFTASEIAVMIEPINNLAIATGEDLTKASEIATSAMRSFGLSAADLSRVIDVMGKALNISSLDLSSWNEAMKYAAPVAHQLGWEVEDVASMTALLANQQIKGSMAGTAMRQIFLKLADSGSNLQKAMGGNIRTFEDFVAGLRRMNEAGISLNEILDATDVRTSTAFSIFTSGVETLADVRNGFDSVNGSIKEMAEINMNTLDAKINQLNSSWLNLITTIDNGDDVFSNFVKGSLTYLSDALNDISYQMQYGNFKKGFLNLLNPFGGGSWKNPLGFIYGQFSGISEKIREITDEDIVKYNDRLRGFLSELSNDKDLGNLEKRREFFEKEIKYFEDLTEARKGLTDGELAIASERANDFVFALNDAFKVISSELKDQSDDYLGNRLKELIDSIKLGEKSLTMNVFSESQKGVTGTRLKFLKQEADEINRILDARRRTGSEPDGSLTEEQLARLKESLRLQYEIKRSAIEGDETLTDSARKAALLKIKKDYDIDLNNLEVQEETKLHLKQQYNELNKNLEKQYLTEIQKLHQSDNDKNIKILYDNKMKELAEKKRLNALELEMEKINLQELKNKLSALPKDDTVGRRTLTDQILGKEFDIRMKEANNEIAEFRFQIEAINDIVGTGEDRSWLISVLGLTDEQISILEDKLKVAQAKLKLITPELQAPEKRDIFSLLGLTFSDDEKDLIIQGLKEVEDAIVSMTDTVVESAKARAEASQARVDELQRELETELQLAEQGFSSNVSLKRQQLEEEKKIRDEALEDQKRAQRQQLILQSALDAANLISTVIKLALTEVGTKGLVGIISAGVGAAGLYALVASVKAKSKEITSYEKGGYEYLKGRSHSEGGISLGEGREAQGGEMLAVFNRKATSKYGKMIEGFVDAINKDKLSINTKNVMSDSKKNIIVNIDNKKLNDIHGVLREIRDTSVTYHGIYKIVRKGNSVRRIRMRE